MSIKKRRSTKQGSTSRSRQPSRTTRPTTGAVLRLPVLSFYREQPQMRGQIDRDRAQRYRNFLKQIKNPTERPAPGIALRAVAPLPGEQNLRILAEGDSWFEYPLPLTHGDGVIYQLQRLLGYGIANMAHHGLEVEEMMGLAIRQEIISRLNDPKVKFDAFALFDLTGSDGHHFALLRLLFGGIGDNDAALRGFFLFQPPHQDAVV